MKEPDTLNETYWSSLRAASCDNSCRMPCSCSGMVPEGYLITENGSVNNCPVRCPKLLRVSGEEENAKVEKESPNNDCIARVEDQASRPCMVSS